LPKREGATKKGEGEKAPDKNRTFVSSLRGTRGAAE